MSEPLTDTERVRIETIAEAEFNLIVPSRSLAAAKTYLRYEATLQAKDAQIGDMQASLDGLDDVLTDKDAQIETLVTEWKGLLTQLLPSGEEAIVCLPSGALWSFDATIKEAANG